MVCEGGRNRVMAFEAIEGLLRAGDLLIFNDTKVVPCRLSGRKATGGQVEIFVLGPLAGGWSDTSGPVRASIMARSNKALSAGTTLEIESEGPATIKAVLEERGEDGGWSARFEGVESLLELVEGCGRTPLPPYIVKRRRDLGEPEAQALDLERYQTVYAAQPGAVAAPTAGLHFSEGLLERLRGRGVELGFLTLHVGIGTFKPLREGSISGQELHEERYSVGEALAAQVARARAGGGRIIAVGTTSVRALEDQGLRFGGEVRPGQYRTRIFIKPGFDWRIVDGMVTNFHMPRSSLMVLVSALAGHGAVMAAYAEAARIGMRFYSYGDAMLLFREPGGER